MKKNEVIVKQNGFTTVGLFLNKHAGKIAVCLMMAMMLASVVFANAGADKAEVMWTQLRDLIQKWVLRLGGVVIFVGGIMFALGWRSEDAEQKSRGISTIIAGALVMAIAGLATTFFA